MKKIIDFFIIVIVCGICLTGCGKGKKVSDKQDFKVDGISEIHVSLESWEVSKILIILKNFRLLRVQYQ